MKEQDKENYNEWAKDNAENISYVKLFIDAFETAFFIIESIEPEELKLKTAFKFLEEINGYIQEKKIKAINNESKKLEKAISLVKKGIDAGFVDFMNLCERNKNQTKKARETKEQMQNETRENEHRKLFYQTFNRLASVDGIKERIAPIQKKIDEHLEDYYQQRLQADKENGLLPYVEPKSKYQDQHNKDVEKGFEDFAKRLISNAIGEDYRLAIISRFMP